MLSTLVLIEISVILQLIYYLCISLGFKEKVTFTYVHPGSYVFLLFFFGQLIDMARLTLILIGLKEEANI